MHLLKRRHLSRCAGGESGSHVGIWGKSIQVEETASAKALGVSGGCQEQRGAWPVVADSEQRGLECPCKTGAFTPRAMEATKGSAQE